jgi:SAM-dependent methyltransferase
MDRWDPPPQRYGEDYFFSAYKKQYGKTYLEDFPVLQKNGEKRLRRIKALLPLTAAPSAVASAPAAGTAEAPTPPRLREIGCAYGPFLAAAAAAGFDPLGIDPAGEAVDYVRAKLGLPAIRGFFPDDWKALPGDGEAVSGVEGRAGPAGGPGLSFDAVSLWFVIEHFRDPRSALEEIYRILKPGGVLAFSTPSFNGVSRRKSAERFLESSPEDHYTIWDPRYCAGVLGKFGFRTRKILITGIHPERLPLVGFLFPPSRRDSGFYRFFSRLCSLLGWGDTFEVYAVKEGLPRG